MLEQRLIRTSALHRRTGEVILWIQLPLNNTYNRYTIPIILLQIDNYHSIILLQIQLPFNNVYFQSTMLLRLQLPLRMQLPPNTDQLLLLLLENLQKSSPAMSGHPLLGNIVISVKTRRWMSPHHPEIHVNRILMHLCSLTGSTQSICGACNAFRGSSHQLETPPSSLHQWETPPFSSHHSQLKAPTLMVPPRSYSEDLQFQNFSLAVDDKM